MENLLYGMSWALLLGGGFLGITGGVGILRFPDFYTRLHAAGITDTLCAGFILLGLMLQAGLGLVTVKLLFILLFLTFTSPTATHALAKAAVHGGLTPLANKTVAAGAKRSKTQKKKAAKKTAKKATATSTKKTTKKTSNKKKRTRS